MYTYRRIAKTPRPLLYLEFEYNLRKIAKNILCYLVKLEYNLREFDREFNTTSEVFSRLYGKLKTFYNHDPFFEIDLLYDPLVNENMIDIYENILRENPKHSSTSRIIDI